MMYLSSIHNKSVGVKENDYIQQHNSFVNAIFEEMETAITNANELIEFNIFTEDAGQSLGTTVSNGLRKIGEKIIAMIKRIKEFISDAITKIKSDIYESKSDEQKLRDFVRKYPDKAKDIKMAVSRGELAFPSYKDLNDFYKNIDQILLEIKKGRVDPKSLRGRWEAAKAKLNDNEKLISNTAKVLGIVVSGVGLYVTLNKFVFDRDKHLREAGDVEKNFERLSKNASTMTEFLTSREAAIKTGTYSDNVSTVRLINDMITYCDKATAGSFGSYMKLNKKWFVGLASNCKTTSERISKIKDGIEAATKYGENGFMTDADKAKKAAKALQTAAQTVAAAATP